MVHLLFLVTFNLLSANAFNLDKAKIVLAGIGIKISLTSNLASSCAPFKALAMDPMSLSTSHERNITVANRSDIPEKL